MGTTWSYLDLTPLGRQETWEDLAKGLPPDPAVQVVELARQLCLRSLPLNPQWLDVIANPQEAARKREAEEKA